MNDDDDDDDDDDAQQYSRLFTVLVASAESTGRHHLRAYLQQKSPISTTVLTSFFRSF